MGVVKYIYEKMFKINVTITWNKDKLGGNALYRTWNRYKLF